MADSDDITHQQILDKIESDNKQLLKALNQQLGTITDNMATKDDLRQTLKNHPTHTDLKQAFKDCATKEDIKSLDSKIDQVAGRLERKILSVRAVNVRHHLETRKEIGKLNRELTEMRESW